MLLGSQALVNDPYYNDVVLLLRGYDATNGQIFKDYSKSNHTITANGNVVHSTTQKKYGNSSIYFDGSGDYLSIPASSDFNLSSINWTIEAWIRIDQQKDQSIFAYSYWNGSSMFPGLNFWVDSTGKISVDDGAISQTHYGSIVLNTWTHIAITRNGSIVYLYKDGLQVGSVTLNAGTNINTIYVGRYIHPTVTNYLSGYIESIRVTKSVSRSIIVPTQPFPNW